MSQRDLFEPEKDPHSVGEKAKAQRDYCKRNGVPMFVSFLGLCFSCNKQVYTKVPTVEAAGSNHITGCPHCRRSFVS